MLKYLKYIAIVALVASHSTFAQQASYTLQNPETGTNKQYVARDFVKLTPGFSYSATQAGQTFNAKIDPYTIDVNPFANQKTSAPDVNGNTYIVGGVSGSASVSPSGASFYEIPIKVSPGTGGMTPQLSIMYNSQGNDGLLGVGFSITGLSSISRVPNNINDGVIRPVMLDGSDKFSLDGNRLVAISGTYGANGTEYRTENNTFSKIISYTTTTTGPESFIVYTKSGLIYEYGKTLDSKFKAQNTEHIITWLLNKVTDTKGNYYIISYTQDRTNGEYKPERIDYTGNANSNPVLSTYCSIRFVYQSRNTTNVTYINGNKSIISNLLTGIQMYYQEDLVKSYTLSYNTPNYGKYLLAKVLETSSTGEKIKPITFNWYTNDTYKPTGREYDQGYYAEQFVKNNNEVYTGDFNGDGKTDFIATPNTGTYANKWGLFLANSTGTQCYYTSSGSLLEGIIERLYTGDFNGDGKTDFILRRKHRYVDKYNDNTYTNYYIYYSTGNGFSLGPCFYTATNTSTELIIGEFNGDGISDVIVYYPGAKNYRTFTSSVSGGVVTPLQEKSVRYISNNWDRVETGDFNGDGLTDIMNLDSNGHVRLYSDGYGTVSSSLTGTWPKKEHVINLGDFNGDGKTDLLVTGWNNMYWSDWVIRFSTGTGFDEVRISKQFDTYSKQIFVGDLNGDGKDDFCAVDKTSSSGSMVPMGLYISNGIGNFSYQSGINVYPTDKWSFYSGDFNGEGRIDFLCKSNSTNGFSGYQLCNSISERDKLLKEVNDSYGNTISFTYKPLTNSSVYTPSTGSVYPVTDLTCAMLVVEKMTQPDGAGGVRTTSYKYEGAKIHKQGKGFLGFSKFTSTDDQTGISSISYYDYAPTYYVSGLKRTETRISKGAYNYQLLSEADYVNAYITYNGYHNPAIYTYQTTSTIEKKYELGSTTAHSTNTCSYTYDEYGNVLTTSQNFGNEAVISTVNVYSNTPSSWILGRLTSATVTKQVTGQSNIVRNSTFEYDPNSGMVTKETVEPDNATLGFSKTYIHDAFGNITSTTTTANGRNRIERSVYDAKGRFAVESYNALNQKLTKVFDPVYGSVTSVTDPNSLTATTVYDSFGRAKSSTGPDGSMSVVAYRWCTGEENAPTNALYYKYLGTSVSPKGAKEYYDQYGRIIRKAVVGFDGNHIYSDTEYNALGQVSRQSDPYFKGTGTIQWVSYIYDEIGRLKQKTLPDGGTIKVTYNGLTVTTENPLGQKDTKTTNQQGLLIESRNNNNKSITYIYNSAGQTTEIHDSKGGIIKMEYDIVGNRTKLDDPDLGVTTSVYNAFGELTSETNAKSNLLTMEYDILGRMTKRTEPEGITEWTYDTGTCGIGRLASVTSPNGFVVTTEYDKLGRAVKENKTIAGVTYTTSTDYDVYSRVLRTHYPSVKGTGPVIRNSYNSNGYLANVSDNQTGKVYWTAGAVNARGQMTQSVYGNGMTTTRTYDDVTGLLNHIKTEKGTLDVQDWGYQFNELGNLISRTDENRGLTESFGYDNLNRVLTVMKNNVQTLAMTYDELGNILTKSDVGVYHYDDPTKLHSLTGITPYAGGIFNSTTQRINYTSFDKVRTIAQGTDSLYIAYGSAYERIYGDSYQNNVLKKRRTYVNGLYEQEKDFITAKIKETFYIFGGDGLVAIRVNDDLGDNVSYVHKDHLGSIQCITNDAGALAQEYSYDAWGKRRDPLTWQVYTTPQSGLMTDRGFTGHEHIDLFDLVNMDGRVYDPVIGRFLSADPIIQDPENLQSLNRYAYCINNPLSLTDPSGYSWLSDNWRSLTAAGIAITVSVLTAGLGSGLGIAIIAGAAGGFAGGFSGVLLNGGNLKQAFVAGVVGGAIGAATGFLSFAAGSVTSTGTAAVFERAAKHAFANMWMGGVKSAIYGGESSPIRDMIGGALSSVGNGLINDNVNGVVLKTASAAVLGGTISEIGGGKFANGAITGAYGMLFNELKHLPEFKKLWFNYPHRVKGQNQHPSRDSYAKNQCAIRVGVALQKSGVSIDSYPEVNQTSEGYPRSSKGLADWLWQNYGKPEIVSQELFDANYQNKTGIIYLAPPTGGIGHIDLWNKGQTGSGYYRAIEVWFWDIK